MLLSTLMVRSQSMQSHQDADSLIALLGRHAGVGLWDAHLHAGDPMHPHSHWWWSGEFRRLIGFDRDDVIGFPDEASSWADRLHPEDAKPTLNAFGACLADRSGRTGYDVSYRLEMKAGGYRWFRAVGGVARRPDGMALRACGALIDIHDQKVDADRSGLLDRHAGIGLWDAVLHQGDPAHPQSHWTWSSEFRRMLGFTREADFPNLMTSWSDRLHPDDTEPTFAAFGASLRDRTGRTPYDVRYRLKTRDGRYRWFRAVGGVLRDNGGAPLRACGSLIDMHAEVIASEARDAADQKRQDTVNQLAATLDAEVSRSAATASTGAQTVAAAAEELSASIAEIAGQVSRAADASAAASEEAVRTDDTVKALVKAAGHITAVVKLIEEIASQTNLLALNATIEAARAGEAGKGFTVVANEVKSLAQQTANATGQITAQITAVQDEASRMVEAITRITDMTRDSQQVTAAMSAAVTEQDTATREIATQISRVVADIGHVSASLSEVATHLRQSARG